MSWSLFLTPLHLTGDLLDELRESGVDGVDDIGPVEARPLPTAGDVLAALALHGAHGSPWFTVDESLAGVWLSECPDVSTCRSSVGEVMLHEDRRDREHGAPWGAAELVSCVSFRKPRGDVVLPIACTLAGTAGHVLCFDTTTDYFVVREGDTPERLAGHWFWRVATG